MSHQSKQSAQACTKQTHLGLGFHGFHRINYLEWGNAKHFHRQETLFCVHGLTRNARDFDYLASKLCGDYRVVCPDVVGRGDSDHIPEDGYNYLQYNADMNALIARLRVSELNWIGSSMGGIIGMVLASIPQTPIKRLIINDIGPEVPREALVAISKYIGRSGDFPNVEAIEAYQREIYHEFAPMSDQDWRQMAEQSSRRTKQGTYRLKVDCHVGEAFRDSISYFNVDMWETWKQITCPVLVLRGKQSSFLTQEIAERMLSVGPKMTLVEFDDTGHTPTLRNDEQVDVITEWMNEH